jgi:hypothetical protein
MCHLIFKKNHSILYAVYPQMLSMFFSISHAIWFVVNTTFCYVTMTYIATTIRWIPDGQLCPTVPNRSNYIHWIEDLLSSDLIQRISNSSETVRGFDIGTGANCIYPLLGASLLGWSFVGSGTFLSCVREVS